MVGSGRTLRARTSRPSYAQFAELDADEKYSVGSGSSDDFEVGKEEENEEDDDEEEDLVAEDADGDVTLEDAVVQDVQVTPIASGQPRGSPTATGSSSTLKLPRPKRNPRISEASIKLLATGDARQHYVKPIRVGPNVDHRHRVGPLYFSQKRVERLATPPPGDGPPQLGPFAESAIKPTNNWSFDETILRRYGRAVGNNVGWGPIWEYMEDRSWWKEGYLSKNIEDERRTDKNEVENSWMEKNRRPRVYESVKVDKMWHFLNKTDAEFYLPAENGACITCFLGPISGQTRCEIGRFESLNMSKYVPDAAAHVFNAGAPVWAIDWCPTYAEDRHLRNYTQYLAVAPLSSKSHVPSIGVKCSRPSKACIQIWSLSSANSSPENPTDLGAMRCDAILCVDSGPAHDIKWCPLPSHDSWSSESAGQPTNARKLGILAGTFEDGSLCIFVVPDPEDFRRRTEDSVTEGSPELLKIEPSIRIELEETSCWSLDWANSTRLAVGCTNGTVAVYDFKPEDLSFPDSGTTKTKLLPSYYISIHQSAIRAISWIRCPSVSANGKLQMYKDPCILATGGYDGCLYFTDLREGGNAGKNIVNRTRDVSNSAVYAHYSTGVITTDGEVIKCFSIHPTTLGRGHSLLEPGGPIWGLGTSDYHGQLAVGCADGSLMTTNSVRSTRRSASVPFFSYKIYQLDYNRKTSEYRMLEQFLPEEVLDYHAIIKLKARSKKGKAKESGYDESAQKKVTGAWPSNVSVTRVVWNSGNGLARAPLLASATASGLCRIDWLLGRFSKDHNPYGGIRVVRKEDGDDDEEGEEDEEGDDD